MGDAPELEPKPEISPEEADRIVQARRQARIAAVEKGIGDLCRANRCRIELEMAFSTGSGQGPRGRLVIIPLD